MMFWVWLAIALAVSFQGELVVAMLCMVVAAIYDCSVDIRREIRERKG